MPDYDYVGPGTYAKKTDRGWVAGPNSKKYSEGTIVSEEYAKSVRASINFRNRVKGLVANPKDSTPDNYSDAQDIIAEFNSLDDALDAADTESEKEEIRREMDDLRTSLGS